LVEWVSLAMAHAECFSAANFSSTKFIVITVILI
jgi:hypothetical protein